MKKKIAWVLALTMSAQLTVGSVAAFSDMRGHWAEKFIDSLKDDGIVEEDGENFRQDDYVNVDEFLKMTLTVMNKEIEPQTGDWAKPYTDTALEEKLVYADEFSSFDRPITRGEVAKIAVRAIDANVVVESRRPQIISRISDYYDIHNEDKE